MDNLRLRYQTVEFGDIDIHLCTLRDRQEFYDQDGRAEKLGISPAAWPIFGVSGRRVWCLPTSFVTTTPAPSAFLKLAAEWGFPACC